MAQWLIKGEVSPKHAELWASEFLAPQYQVEYSKAEKYNNPMTQLLDALAIAAETHDGINPMYNKTAYQEWLKIKNQ